MRRRRRPARRRMLTRVWRIALGLLLLAAVSLAAYGAERARQWVVADGRFPIETIRVSGNRLLLEGEVLALAMIQRGENLLGVDPAAVRERLKDSDWIVGATVRRKPPGTLEIRVSERLPWLFEPVDDAMFVDREGVRFRAMDKDREIDVPILVDLSERGGEIVRALAMISPPEDDWVSRSTAQVTIDRDGAVTIFDMRYGTSFLLGERPFEGKGERLRAVLQEWESTGQWYRELDLRYEGQAIAREPIELSRR